MSGSSNALLDAIANPRQVDVAGAYGTANRLAQGIWANRLAQSQQAAGQAALGAIGPDGTFNAQRLNQNLAADPSTAMSAQESMQRGSTNATTDFDLHMKRLTGLNAAAMALTAQYPNGVPQDAVNKEIDRVAPTYGISPQEAATLKSQFSGDPIGNSRMLIRNGIANLTAQEALHASRPSTGTQTGPGGTLQGYQVAPPAAGPGAGAVSSPQQPGAPQGPGADQLSGVSMITDSQGTPHTDSLYGHIANGRVTPMGTPAPGYSVAPATGGDYSRQPLMGGMKTPVPGSADDLTNPTMPGQTEAAPGDYKVTPPLPRAGPRSGGTTGPAPTLLKVQQDSVDQYGADSRAAGTYQDRVFPLQQAAKALETAKTGEGSEALQSIASRIQTLTPDALKNIIPNIRTPDEIAAYDEARKYLTMAQQNRPGADRSDAGLATAGASSPSTHISPAAAKLLVQAQLGVERSKQAQFLEFNATHPQGTEGQYARWLSDRAAKIDPRAFITDSQTPAERKSYYDRLGATEKTNYLDSYALAKRQGLLTLPNNGR